MPVFTTVGNAEFETPPFIEIDGVRHEGVWLDRFTFVRLKKQFLRGGELFNQDVVEAEEALLLWAHDYLTTSGFSADVIAKLDNDQMSEAAMSFFVLACRRFDKGLAESLAPLATTDAPTVPADPAPATADTPPAPQSES